MKQPTVPVSKRLVNHLIDSLAELLEELDNRDDGRSVGPTLISRLEVYKDELVEVLYEAEYS